MRRIIMFIIFLCYSISILSQLKFKNYEMCGSISGFTLEIISDTSLVIIADLNCTHCVDYPTHVEIYCEYRIEGDSLYIGNIKPSPESSHTMFLCHRDPKVGTNSMLDNWLVRSHNYSCIVPNPENSAFLIITDEETQFLCGDNVRYFFRGVNDE